MQTTTDRRFLEAIGASDPPEVAQSMEDLNGIALLRLREECAVMTRRYVEESERRLEELRRLRRRWDYSMMAIFALALIVAYMAVRG